LAFLIKKYLKRSCVSILRDKYTKTFLYLIKEIVNPFSE